MKRRFDGMRFPSVAIITLLTVISSGWLVFDAGKLLAQDVDFVRDVKPILSDRCYFCHGPDSENRQADLRLDTPDGLEYVLSPGEPDESELLRRILSDDPDEIMPPPASKLSVSKEESEILAKWIKQGATWEQHWAFVNPAEVKLPEPKNESAIYNEIDRFVIDRLEKEGLQPSPIVSREKLIRRVTFDLTGLPPTLSEIDAFVADEAANAYEKVVDRLLSSPHYGERMASDWLDVARYSDTYGYQVDRDRFVWPWRDWVIRAFNQNMKYDQFIAEQLAGDLLPNATDDQILATTFNRLHPQKVEGGSVEEEFRVEYVADRTQTVGTALLGLTVECARCHDHKYDPISQKEYYQLFAFFNNIDEAGLYSYFDPESIPTPSLLLTDESKKNQLDQLTKDLHRLGQQFESARIELRPVFEEWMQEKSNRHDVVDVPFASEPSFVANFETAELARNELVGAEEDGTPVFVRLTGDDEIKFETGSFQRFQPFSIATRIKVPATENGKPIERNVIFHRSRAWTDSASRGYQLLIENGRLSASLIHFWPGNAICVTTCEPVVTDQWVEVVITYDGSSNASGLKIYIDGKLQKSDVIRDKLQKKIVGTGTDHLIVGARFRDRGFTGGEISQLRVFDRKLTAIEIENVFKSGISNIDGFDETQRFEFFVATQDETKQLLNKIRDKRKALAELTDSIDEIMVMRELDEPRPAFLLARGAYDAPTEPVTAETPAIFPELAKSEQRPNNRLDLARWLTDGNHPLTSRVAVNRLWQMLFGEGLVRTPEDFGNQGAQPTHPRLLDWLAKDFQSDWDMQRALKQMVMSRTYQQSTAADEDMLRTDPDNVLLSRGPTYRLSAEMLRDNVLMQSGLLVDKIGGAPVRPYEVAVAFKPATPDTGEGLYRRSLYTYWKRTGPAPVMLTLDAAKRDVCQVKRERTDSPLQALVLLNGPQFVEAARKMAENLIAKHGEESDAIVDELFRMLTSRVPTPSEATIIKELFDKQRARFENDLESAKKLIEIGASKSEAKDPAVLAAWTAVANTLMNFDECVMKR